MDDHPEHFFDDILPGKFLFFQFIQLCSVWFKSFLHLDFFQKRLISCEDVE